MAKYMFTASYTLEGLQGLKKEGAAGRMKGIEELASSAGGSIELVYWAFGHDDIVIIADVPDNAAAAGIALTVSASGAASVSTTVLLTADEVDQAMQAKVLYRPPGQ